MTMHPVSGGEPPRGRSGLDDLWAGIAIAAMWLAVLAVGLWGGDIRSSGGASNAGGFTSVPVVAVVAPCALLATVAVVRHVRR
jgi:hypothetical protein